MPDISHVDDDKNGAATETRQDQVAVPDIVIGSNESFISSVVRSFRSSQSVAVNRDKSLRIS